MTKIKQLIAKNFQSFTYFYRHLRYRLFLLVALSIGVGILDGFGLAMFLPLLEMVNEAEQADGGTLGNLKFIVDGMHWLGLSLNLVSILMVMVVFFTVKGVIKFINGAYLTIIRQFFVRRIREQLLAAFNQLRYKYFVKSDVGRIQNTMSVEVERVSAAFQYYTTAMEQAVLVVVYMGFAFFVDFRFALLVSFGGYLTNILYKVVYMKTKGVSRKFTHDSHLYQGQIIQHVANFKYLKATATLVVYATHLQNSIVKIEKSRRKMGILNAILTAAREPLLIVVVAIVILIQTLVIKVPLGPILVSLLFFYRALTALLTLQGQWNRFLEMSGSMENVISFQNEIRENKEKNGNYTIQAFQRSLELNEVYFTYSADPILENINLCIEKNETIAFLGESGSGKTTLINIMAGLLVAEKGYFMIDGIDFNKLEINSYQKRLGYITQEPVIFNDTIYNNVTLWAIASDENQKRFDEALKKAAVAGFVNDLPNGQETMLGQNGVSLSGGQKQRISIARELFKDIDILIMDEATSALDSETEKAIQQSIEQLKGQYTILIVAHRLSTIRNADRIVLMKQGKIEDTGGFDELLDRSGLFRKMVELQEL